MSLQLRCSLRTQSFCQGNVPRWCTGCGDHGILTSVQRVLRDEQIVERPADQRTITRRYADDAVRFIENHADRPFFLYLAHSLPHVPLFRGEKFAGKSLRGLYGDVVEEIDDSTLLEYAIQGMLMGLAPHSVYLTRDAFQEG